MTYLQNGKFAPLKGRSTDGGKIKDDVKVHYFAGSNHFLSGLKNKVHEDQTIQLLRTAAELDIDFLNAEIERHHIELEKLDLLKNKVVNSIRGAI